MDLASILGSARGTAAHYASRIPRLPMLQEEELIGVAYLAVAEGLATHDPALGSVESRCTSLVGFRLLDHLRQEIGRGPTVRHVMCPLDTSRLSPLIPNYDRQVLLAQVVRRFSLLTGKQRESVVGQLCGKSDAALSTEMRCSEVTVSAHRRLALRKLRSALVSTKQAKGVSN